MNKTRMAFLVSFLALLSVTFLMGSAYGEMNFSVSGLELGEPDEGGKFLVTRVYEDSPAEYAGIMAMDLLVEVDHLSITDKSASEVENALSRRIGEGRSSVLTLLGSSGRIVTWLKPARYSIEERETLDFCQKLIWQNNLANAYWEQANQLFREVILGNISVEKFEEEMPQITRGITQSRLAISGLSLPLHVSSDVASLCSKTRNLYANTQFLRNDARAKMQDYAKARWGDKTFIQERWEKIEPAVMAADKRYSHGDIMLDQVLRSIGYDKGNLRVEH